MQAPSRPSSPLPASVLFAVLAAALAAPGVPSVAGAQTSAADRTRADFPDRRWTPVTAADGGLAGAGLATDPFSSAYANPALWLAATWSFRLSGELVNPSRDDLRAATLEYDEANGFPALGEAAVRFQAKGLGFGAYFSQPHYEHGETRFIGFNPANPEAGGDPYPRINTYTSATRYAGAGAALRLQGGVMIGAGLELAMTEEDHESVPDVPPGTFVADTVHTERNGSALGGVVGVAVPIAGTWTVGASFRAAGETSDGEATDEPPMVGLLGVRYGRTAGSAAHAGLRWIGERTVNLAEPGVPDDERTAPSRLEYAAGYAYLDPAGTWTIRAGAAYSPRPDDASNKLTRFGLSVGVGGEGLRGSLAYAREAESRPEGRNSSRNLVLATFELGR